MKIIVNFDRNWTNNDVEAIAKNPNLTAHDLNMDVDAYLEALVVASLITEDFERNLQIAMETKGYATPADIRPVPYSEILRRFSGSKNHATAVRGV